MLNVDVYLERLKEEGGELRHLCAALRTAAISADWGAQIHVTHAANINAVCVHLRYQDAVAAGACLGRFVRARN